MGLFKRRNANQVAKDEEPKESRMQRFLRRPANTAFKQQRLKAWQPILTPKVVIPTLIVLGLLFAPIGAVMVWGSDQVSNFSIEYTGCTSGGATDTFQQMPSDQYSYSFSGGNGVVTAPQWQYLTDPNNPNVLRRQICNIVFTVPKTMTSPVFLYQKFNNYYQNHRRYVRSVSTDQMKGDAVSYSSIQGGTCKPLDVIGDRIIYPCGLIANSFPNDTYTQPILIGAGGNNQTYNFTDIGIAWSDQTKGFAQTQYTADQIVPPPYWANIYPNGYNSTNIFNPSQNEHFWVWMRTAALPTFRKLYFRNDNEDLEPGNYAITIYDNYPVEPWGHKSLEFSTTAWIGGKNPFLGWAYVATSALCILVGVALAIRHLVKPRRLGDLSYLSWNQPAKSAR